MKLYLLALYLCYSINLLGQDIELKTYEQAEYSVQYDASWKLVELHNFVHWKLIDNNGIEQFNFVIENLNDQVGNNLALYSIAAVSSLSKTFQKYQLVYSWESSRNSVCIAYQAEIDNSLKTYIQYWIVKNQKAYILSYPHAHGMSLQEIRKIGLVMQFMIEMK